MKIIHVITGLNDGGAESVLYRLCKYDNSCRHLVISLSSSGKYGPLLESISVCVVTLNMVPGRPSLWAFIKLIILLRRLKPDVVQTWMYHADFLGGIAAYISRVRMIVWGIHNTILEPGNSKRATILIVQLLAKLSWLIPSYIVACAKRAMEVHEALGYDHSKMRFIPNGYDLSCFKQSVVLRSDVESRLLHDSTIPLLGMIGRFDPYKDHINLLDALAILRDHGQPFKCILVGTGLNHSNPQIIEWINQRGLDGHISLLGQRNDIPGIMNALDLHILSSSAEAFPNVVAEAMACGTPCVVTDVGDAAQIVGDTGWIVPPRNASALAQAIEVAITTMLTSPDEWALRCIDVRRRIEDSYSVDRMISDYHNLWSSSLI